VFVCLFVHLIDWFYLHEQFFSCPAAVANTDDRAAILDLFLVLMVFNTEGSFTIFTFKFRALGEGGITTYLSALSLTRPARAGLELTTSRMTSESATTRHKESDQCTINHLKKCVKF
jgi:hypothetical protein